MNVIDKYGKLADDLHTDLHECLGHGSGQLAPGVKGGELKNYTSTLEEARADLFGLYYLGDPKMVELGLIPSLDVAYAEYARYIMNGMMTQLARIEPGKNVEEAHMRNRKLIAEWCYEQGKPDNVIEWVEQDGKTYVVVNDYTKLRELLGRMLREVQRIKSEGDFEAGKALVERYAVTGRSEAARAKCATRYKALDIEPYSGFVNPRVRAGGEERQGRGCEGFLSERLREADARIQPGLLLPAESELRLNDTLKSGETGTQFPLIVFLRRMENRKMR